MPLWGARGSVARPWRWAAEGAVWPGDGTLRPGRVLLLAVLVESQSEPSEMETVRTVSGGCLVSYLGVARCTGIQDILLLLTRYIGRYLRFVRVSYRPM